MPMRHDQRQHIIRSLENFVYQLNTLSFLLSPSLLPYLCRTIFQFQFARPREMDPHRSMRFWYFLVIFFNAGSIWKHATEGPEKDRSIILDFIGPASLPSKTHLLLLDFAIIVLNMLLTTIAYETSLQSAMPKDTPDPLLPIPTSMLSLTTADLVEIPDNESPYVIDLRPALIIERLRHSAPEPQSQDTPPNDMPLPVTTPLRTINTFRTLLRARTRAMERRNRPVTQATTQQDHEEADRAPSRTLPGGLGTGDVT